MKKLFFAIFIVIILSACANQQVDDVVLETPIRPAATVDLNRATPETLVDVEPPATSPDSLMAKPRQVPSTFDQDVLFASQAPFGNWELPYQEACEEASLIMAYKYFAKQELDKNIMDKEINKLVDWELGQFGYYTDTNLDEVTYMAEQYFGLDVEISEKAEVEYFKELISSGYLLIVPASGRDLDNPNFTSPGPIFHMLIVRGYDRNQFITNDPGTRKGLKFKYHYNNLISAIHDLIVENSEQFRPYELKDMPDSQKLIKMRSGPQRFLIIKGLK
ncbi:MAG: C39 family peptidase [Patescibacteria group bacterium]